MKKRTISAVYLAAGLIWLMGLAPAAAQTCSDSLETATPLYNNARFDEAIAMLTPCWEDKKLWRDAENNYNVAGHRDAVRMLAISFLYQDNLIETHAKMRHLMRKVDQGYRSDPLQDPIKIQELAKRYRIKFYERRWFQGAVLGAAITTWRLTRPDDPPPTLPDPPGDPSVAN